MSIKQSSKEHSKRKKAKWLLPFLSSSIFLVAITILYGSLGTFMSSCGNPTSYAKTSLSFVAPQGTAYCNMPTSGNLCYLASAIGQQNWKLRIVVTNQQTGAALRTYDFYQSLYSTNSSGAYIDGTLVRDVEIPENNIAYKVTGIFMAYCGCNTAFNEAHYWKCEVNFPVNQLAGAPLGVMNYWEIFSCTQFF